MELLRTVWGLLFYPGILYLLAMGLLLSWLDRKLIALWQGRVGPPWYQPLADLIKLLGKEDIVPYGTDKRASALAPIVALACTMTAGLMAPVGNTALRSFQGDLIVVLFLLSVPSLAYFVSGWVMPSPYAVLGGSRSLLQYFSYEVPLLLGMAAPAVYEQSWQILTLMTRQNGYHWHVFIQPVGFGVALLGLIGKLERGPFDMPHAKAEVGAGPLTECSGRRLALWQLTAKVQTLVGINLLTSVYLGGADALWGGWGLAIYLVKVTFFMALLSLVQVLYARLRVDQMADASWRYLVPLGLVQILLTVWMG